jgi:hypothetical protein
MSIEGRIAIDIGFTDTHTTEGVSAVQRITLTETDSYTSGKVAVLTGTITTAGTTFGAATGYRDASGNTVTFAEIDRVAFKASQDSTLSDDAGFAKIRCRTGRVAVGELRVGGGEALTLARTSALTWTAGTASYTLVLYGI